MGTFPPWQETRKVTSRPSPGAYYYIILQDYVAEAYPAVDVGLVLQRPGCAISNQMGESHGLLGLGPLLLEELLGVSYIPLVRHQQLCLVRS